jgi:hypothetical protein
MKAKRPQATGPKAVRGSEAARRKAALLLEAWSGVRSTQSASEAMGVAVTRFYQLEARALQLIVSAMEPRPRGRQTTLESELHKLRQERQRLVRDVERYQALYRTSQRALGVVVAKSPDGAKNPAPGQRRKRGPRQKARGQAVAAVLAGGVAERGDEEVEDGKAEQGPGPRRWPVRRGGAQAPAACDPGHAER